MDLDEVGEVVRSYPWKCIECKICEICQEKGDDVSPSGLLDGDSFSKWNGRNVFYFVIFATEVGVSH